VNLDPLLPNEKELRALYLFVSTDETRQHLATLWAYSSEGGATYVATDGHTEIIRRSGSHRTMVLADISKLEAFAVDKQGEAFATITKPTAWYQVMKAPRPGHVAPGYGINPDYVARVGDVERAAGHRAAEDFVPPVGWSVKLAKEKRTNLKTMQCAIWTSPSDPLDPWYWRLETDAARWEGVIMPRRV